jgi:hypothetical protein
VGSKIAPLKQRGRSGSNSRVRLQGRPELKIHLQRLPVQGALLVNPAQLKAS